MTDETTTTPEENTTPAPAPEAPAAEAKPAATSTDKKPADKPTDDNRPRGRAPRRGGRRDRSRKEPKEFEEAILRISRVTRVVKGGRRMRFQITVVIGDKKGRVGLGIGKSGEVIEGIKKAVTQAKKNLVHVSMLDGSVPHRVDAKFKASKVFLLPAPKGKGIIAGGAVRKILELAGYKDVLSKAHGSRNALNLAYATFDALSQLKKVKIEAKADETAEASEEKGEEKSKAPAAKKTAPKKKAPAKKPAAKKADK